MAGNGLAFYSENDPFAAAWLRQLIAAGLIAPGIVDERSIEDITPDDVRDFTQFHAFAGIGCWSLALRRAGWRDEWPCWTGSEPCQPFSAAGKGGGFADERYLRPVWHHLVDQCRPDVLFGEQVSSKDGLAWLDAIQNDMEGTGYAFGSIDMCSAGVGAPHIRQRINWFAIRVADAEDGDGRGGERGTETGTRADGERRRGLTGCGDLRFLADATSDRRGEGGTDGGRGGPRDGAQGIAAGRMCCGDAGRLDDDDDARPQGHAGHDGAANGRGESQRPVTAASVSGGLADVRRIGLGESGECDAETGGDGTRERGDAVRLANADGGQSGDRDVQRGGQHGQRPQDAGIGNVVRIERPGPVNGFWRDADWLFCRDDKWRPVESGTFPLVDGPAGRVVRSGDPGAPIDAVSSSEARVGRLRGYGNAVNVEQTQVFIECVMDILRCD